jgi:hypothetical protein
MQTPKIKYIWYIDNYENDTKEDILSVSELHRHTTSSEHFLILNGLVEETSGIQKFC